MSVSGALMNPGEPQVAMMCTGSQKEIGMNGAIGRALGAIRVVAFGQFATVTALAGLCGPVWADVLFTSPPTIVDAPHAVAGGGSVTVVGAGGAVSSAGGFAYTNVAVTYTTVASDAGNPVALQWKIRRPFTVVNQPFRGRMKARVAGDISVLGGAALSDVQSVGHSTSVQAVAGVFADAFASNPGSSFSEGPNSSLVFNLPLGLVTSLEMLVTILMDVPAGTPAGSIYIFMFPNSADAQIEEVDGIPNGIPTLPAWGLVVLAISSVMLGALLIHRRESRRASA